MVSFLDGLTQWSMGGIGRAILEVVNNNLLIFLLLAAIYGGIIFHSKLVYKILLPKRLNHIVYKKIKEQQFADKNELYEQIHQEWQQELKHLPFYYIVPTRNEFWVKKPEESYRSTKKLFYNNTKTEEQDEENIIWNLIYQNMKGLEV